MKPHLLTLLLLTLGLNCYKSPAQSASANHDTVALRQLYCKAIATSIDRETFWDSLAGESHRLGCAFMESRVYLRFAYVCFMKENRIKTEQCYSRSIQVAEQHQLWSEMMRNLRNAASYYSSTNDTQKALELCYKGLKKAEELRDTLQIAFLDAQLGDIYVQSGEVHKALKLHKSSLQVFEKLNHPDQVAVGWLNLGMDHIALKDTLNMIDAYLRALACVNTIKDPFLIATIHNCAAAAYAFKRRYDSAYYYGEMSYAFFSLEGNKTSMAGTLGTMADISYKMGNNSTARQQAEKALEMARSVNFKIQIPNLALILKKIYIKDGDHKAALAAHELYTAYHDSISGEENRKQLLEKEYTYQLEKKEDENKLLAQDNQIQALRLSQKNYLLVGFCILLFLVLGGVYLFTRQNRLQSEQQRMQFSHKLLQLQMNPHFIFNSLQAIQAFILRNRPKEAAAYLSSFADVMRHVLENSREEKISLKKEILLLENYLLLQKLRFNNRFDYHIHVDETIAVGNVFVPPMLLQPFIENAVEHGMHLVQENGKIDVSYTVKDNYLLADVTDNGGGMKQKQQGEHRSLAIEITRERIELMNRKAKLKTTFTITEVLTNLSHTKGVKVSFSIPLEPQVKN